MERNLFNGLLKGLMLHLYDFAALETHPFAALVEPPTGFEKSRGRYLQQFILAEIEQMQPAGRPYSLQAVEWRPYIILQKRYVEGLPLHELAKLLSISERQMRRDHSRALQALAERLWATWGAKLSANRGPQGPEEGAPGFEAHPETLDLGQVVHGLAQMLAGRLAAEGVDLNIDLPGDAVRIRADRVILRQILIALVNYAIHLQTGQQICLRVAGPGRLSVAFAVDENWETSRGEECAGLLDAARFWTQHLEASLQEHTPRPGSGGDLELALHLPPAGEALILVVDDQPLTQQMYRRYLSRSPYRVVGLTDPRQALATARQLRPAVICLDVMMPLVDGWEVLQSLKADPQTQEIPVVVCSAWEEPELAHSLGAWRFLKKPITQRDLLAALEGIGGRG